MRHPAMICVLAAAGTLSAPAAHAAVVGLTPVGSPGYGNQNYAWGFQFDVTASIEVTGLGYYALPDDGEGLLGTHTVSLWALAAPGAALNSVSVGPGASVLGSFAYTPVSRMLAPGTYALSGSYDPADLWYQVFAVAPGPGIANVQARYDLVADVYPGAAAGAFNFGPNFTYVLLESQPPEVLPEPGSLALLGCGLLLAGIATLRRQAF